jgi:hypothetical protein
LFFIEEDFYFSASHSDSPIVRASDIGRIRPTSFLPIQRENRYHKIFASEKQSPKDIYLIKKHQYL